MNGEHGPVGVLAGAATQMAREPDQVPAIAVRAALELGFDGAAFRVMEDRHLTHRTLVSAGLLERGERLASGVVDLLLRRGTTVLATRASGDGEAPLPASEIDASAALACPIWVAGWLEAVLVGVTGTPPRPSPDITAAFELLAIQAGLVLDNAQRMEERRQTDDRLEQGERLKAQFLTTVSHEMRTPLTVLMGNGSTLERAWNDLDDEGRLTLLGGMNANVRILDGMLTNLLDYARLEAGELWVSFEPFDISGMLQVECDRSVAELGDRQLRIEIDEDLLASGDGVLIRRIVANLLGNAIVHTPPETTIIASCRRREGEVQVTVADDGPGIDEHDLHFIGERFFRSGDVNTRPRGLGLGLALALAILDLHGSSLLVENVPEGGVRCSFSLPCVPDPATVTTYAPPHDRP
jgi:signal transduction histidine kinase